MYAKIKHKSSVQTNQSTCNSLAPLVRSLASWLAVAFVRTWYKAARWHGTSFSWGHFWSDVFDVFGEFPETVIDTMYRDIDTYILLDINCPGTLIFIYTRLLYLHVLCHMGLMSQSKYITCIQKQRKLTLRLFTGLLWKLWPMISIYIYSKLQTGKLLPAINPYHHCNHYSYWFC